MSTFVSIPPPTVVVHVYCDVTGEEILAGEGTNSAGDATRAGKCDHDAGDGPGTVYDRVSRRKVGAGAGSRRDVQVDLRAFVDQPITSRRGNAAQLVIDLVGAHVRSPSAASSRRPVPERECARSRGSAEGGIAAPPGDVEHSGIFFFVGSEVSEVSNPVAVEGEVANLPAEGIGAPIEN